MKWIKSLVHVGASLVLETPVRGRSLAQLSEKLRGSGEAIEQHLQALEGTPAQREKLSHIIGIERWGQRRLCVFLGEPSIPEEYDGYRPPDGSTWMELKRDFHHTREETLATIREIEGAELRVVRKVRHNFYGDLSPRAWLRYLDMHAFMESRKLRA